MKHLALVVACGGLLLAGCGGPADEELSRVLGDNLRRMVEQANTKPPVTAIDPEMKPTAKTDGP